MFKRAFLALLFVTIFSTAAFANFERGKLSYDQRNWKLAIFYLRPLAETGDPRAMVILGNMYEQGYGVDRDVTQAYGLYRKAALNNNTDGIVLVAAMHQQGIGTQKSTRRAIQWYKRGAELGHPVGSFFYGLFLLRGNKTGQDDDLLPDHPEAYKWFRITAQRTQDENVKKSATTIADRLMAQLPADRIREKNTEIETWQPADPTTLGPAPDEIDERVVEPEAPAPKIIEAVPPAEAPVDNPTLEEDAAMPKETTTEDVKP